MTDPRTWRWPGGVELPRAPGWPAVLRAGALVLRPLYARDEAAWDELRRRNSAWLSPWEATPPPESGPWCRTVSQMRRHQWRQGRAGAARYWMMAWDPGWPDEATWPSRTTLIGSVTVAGITYGSARFASIGYWIGQDFAGRGLTPLAVALAIDYCLAVLKLHRVQIDICPDNTKSLRVVEKLGLRCEGVKPRYLHIGRAWADHLGFAIDISELSGPLTARLLGGGPVPRGSA